MPVDLRGRPACFSPSAACSSAPPPLPAPPGLDVDLPAVAAKAASASALGVVDPGGLLADGALPAVSA